MIDKAIRTLFTTLLLNLVIVGYCGAEPVKGICGNGGSDANCSSTLSLDSDIKVGETFYDTMFSGYNALPDGGVLQIRSPDFIFPSIFNRPIFSTLWGGYDSIFTSDSGRSTIHGSIRVTAGTVKHKGLAIADGIPPAPGNNGDLATVNASGSAISLQMSTASSAAPGDDLLYRVYYSDTHTLTSVADMETYGTPAGDFSPSVMGWIAGKIDNGLYFSGSDYVDAGNGTAINFGTGSFTVESWINVTSWTDSAGIIGKGAGSAGAPGYALRLAENSSGKFLQFVIGNGVQQVATAQSGYLENKWYHVVGVADRTKNVLQLFVNGVLASSTALTAYTGSTDSAVNLSIGRQSRFFNGIIDEAAMYNRALTGAEVAVRYHTGAGRSVAAMTGLAAGWRFDEVSGTTARDNSGGGNTGFLHFSSPIAAINVTGLADATTYSVNILAMNRHRIKSAYNPVTVITPPRFIPIDFSGSIISNNMFHPTVADFNNDNLIEPMGTFNDGNGNLLPFSGTSMGLSRLFTPGRIHRTCSMADFNGDRLPDLVCNVFSMHEPYTGSDPICRMMSASTPYSPNSVAMLFFNNGDATFTESPQFANKNMSGVHGETILSADFNNDSCTDIFWPQATGCSPNEQNYLLINDCDGNFIEVADQAGVAMRNTPTDYRGEGAQALDFNGDGWIDFYVGSHLFINNGANGLQEGVPTFTDLRDASGLPLAFDEGIKFTDWNNDGYLDLIIHHPTTGPVLYQFDGAKFAQTEMIPSFSFSESYGLNVFDMNNDGREDIIVSGGTNLAGIPDPTVVWLNNGTGFERSNTTPMDAWGQGTISFGDISSAGKLDTLKLQVDSPGHGLAYFRNATPIATNSFLKIEMVGSDGEQNQQGRIVKIYPQKHPHVTFTRFVDSGSGYLTQSPYEIFVGTPYQEPHRVDAYFAGEVVTFTVNPGEKKRVFPDGTVVNY